MQIAKKGLRVLGIAESFSGRVRSTLAGIVMRRDLRIDGFGLSQVTVGGMDATDGVIALFSGLKRQDINLIMMSGCVIAWFNVIDPDEICRRTGLPLITVTYEDSEGLEGDIARHFPGDEERLAAYMRLGERVPVSLDTGHTIYIRSYGLPPEDAARLCNALTFDGKIPEPLRVARLLARALMQGSGGVR